MYIRRMYLHLALSNRVDVLSQSLVVGCVTLCAEMMFFVDDLSLIFPKVPFQNLLCVVQFGGNAE